MTENVQMSSSKSHDTSIMGLMPLTATTQTEGFSAESRNFNEDQCCLDVKELDKISDADLELEEFVDNDPSSFDKKVKVVLHKIETEESARCSKFPDSSGIGMTLTSKSGSLDPGESKSFDENKLRRDVEELRGIFAEDLGELVEDIEKENTKWLLKSVKSQNTNKQIRFGVSLLKKFSSRAKIDFEIIDNKALDILLAKFFQDARNRLGGQYSSKSIAAIRYSLQQYFLKTRGVNIMRNAEFSLSNRTGKIMIKKLRLHEKHKGLSHQHLAVSSEDLMLMQDNLDMTTPTGLQQKVFLDTMLHFGAFGMKFLQTMEKKDFIFHQESYGKFVTLREDQEVKMYARPGDPRCPVASLEKYMSLLSPVCDSFWQRARAKSLGECGATGYMSAALGRNTLGKMTRVISESTGCSRKYTNKSLRKTCRENLPPATASSDAPSASSSNPAASAPNVTPVSAPSNSLMEASSPIPPSSTQANAPSEDVGETFAFTLPLHSARSANSKAGIQQFVFVKAPGNPTTVQREEIKNFLTVSNAISSGFPVNADKFPVFASASNNAAIKTPPKDKKELKKSSSDMVTNKGTMTEVHKFGRSLEALVKFTDGSTQWKWQDCAKQLPALLRCKDTSTQWEKLDGSSQLLALLQSSDASTQWEEQDGCQHAPSRSATHSSRCYTNVHGDNADGQSVYSNESAGLITTDECIMQSTETESDGSYEDFDMDQTRCGESSTTTKMRIRAEMCDKPKDYQDVYIKEEYIDDDYRETADMDNASYERDYHLRTEKHSLRNMEHTRRDGTLVDDDDYVIGPPEIYYLKFHVTQGALKQIITMASPRDTVTGAILSEAVCSRFLGSRGGLALQYFDDFWQDWVDVEPSMVFGGTTRLNIIEARARTRCMNESQAPSAVQKDNELRYHVTLGDTKQLLTISSPGTMASGATIREAVRCMLQDIADGFSLQYFDEDWQDWVTLHPSMTLGGRVRLNVIQTSFKD